MDAGAKFSKWTESAHSKHHCSVYVCKHNVCWNQMNVMCVLLPYVMYVLVTNLNHMHVLWNHHCSCLCGGSVFVDFVAYPYPWIYVPCTCTFNKVMNCLAFSCNKPFTRKSMTPCNGKTLTIRDCKYEWFHSMLQVMPNETLIW